MKIEFLDEATDDLVAGFHFYEKQGEGLGDYFLKSLIAEIEALKANAGVHGRVLGSHRCISRRFPYAIYYRIEKDVVRIRAVWDCRGHPAKLRRRLKKR